MALNLELELERELEPEVQLTQLNSTAILRNIPPAISISNQSYFLPIVCFNRRSDTEQSFEL